mmetsp:Transcript_24677/g.58581  ORF Transcript_24677/g.58581 Transcript_24677/m.58581 type:complete len:232 (+) Transcript_24677:615-1310(+)
MPPSSMSVLKGYWTCTVKRTSSGPVFSRRRDSVIEEMGLFLSHRNSNSMRLLDSFSCGATKLARIRVLKMVFPPPPFSTISVHTSSSSTTPGCWLKALKVNLKAVFGSKSVASGSTRKTKGPSGSFFFLFMDIMSSFLSFFLSFSFSLAQAKRRPNCPWFFTTTSREQVWVVKTVPKSKNSNSSSQVTGVSAWVAPPFARTWTMRSSPSLTMRFNVSTAWQVSSIRTVSAS